MDGCSRPSGGAKSTGVFRRRRAGTGNGEPYIGNYPGRVGLGGPTVGARLDVLETAAGDRSGDDFVTAGEFRLFKWLGTFALAAVLGGFGLLYEQDES